MAWTYSDAVEYLDKKLAWEIEAGEQAKQDFIKLVADYGVAHAIKFSEGAMRAQARASVAHEVKALADRDGLQAVLEWLRERIAREVSYIVPGNSDLVEQVHRIQARAAWAELLASLVNQIEE